jgi:hypothetical protein
MFSSNSSSTKLGYGLEMPPSPSLKLCVTEVSNTDNNFTKSRLYQLMVSKGNSQEEMERMNSLFAGYNCDLYLENSNVQAVQLRLTDDLTKDTITDSKFESYNLHIVSADGKVNFSIPLRKIRDVYQGHDKFPKHFQLLTTKANCFSVMSNNHPTIHVSMAFTENRNQWVKGLKLWFATVSRPTKTRSSLTLPPQMITIPRSLYTDLVTHLQQANLKLAQITHAMNGNSAY